MLTIGSRGSQLALWQAHWIEGCLASRGESLRIEIIKTTGDRITDVPLAKVGSKGLFTKEIEEALLCGRIDLAVHSLKDLPTEVPRGLVIAAVPEREDPRDALVGCRRADLSRGAKGGTSSLRRVAQFRALRPDLVIESVRGNLDTRLRKLDEGRYDAIVLAAAGLKRLGWESRIAEVLPPDLMCPAVGQGALAVETRADEGLAYRACAVLDHAATRAAVTAERALGALGGGCQVPIGAHASIADGRLRLYGLVASPDGSAVIRRETSGPLADAQRLGAELGRELLAAGGGKILEAVYGCSVPLPVPSRPLDGLRIVVTRARGQAEDLSRRLDALGGTVIEFPTIDFRPAADTAPLDNAIAHLSDYDWIIFTSANGVRFFVDRLGSPASVLGSLRARVCAIGPATRRAVENLHIKVDLMPDEYVAESLVRAFEAHDLAGKRILLPRAAVARDLVPQELARRGAHVDVVETYRTVVPEDAAARAKEIFFGGSRPDWITFTSSSTVRNFLSAAGPEALHGVHIASIGPVTTATLRQHGLVISTEAAKFTIDGLVEAIVNASMSAPSR